MQNFMNSEDPLALERIRSVLVRLEDTILFSLIERSQFAHNPRCYAKDGIPALKEHGFDGSWLEWFLKETETFQGSRTQASLSPDETPFTADLPPPIIPPPSYPKILHPHNVNVNPSILSYYVHHYIPRITQNATLAIATANRARGIKGEREFDDDGNYGSAATVDVELLQAMSKRVHYGKFVSESKFRASPSDFIPHILKPNREALEGLIVKPEVERALLARVRKKATLYSQELDLQGEPLIIDGDVGRDGKIDKVRKGRFRVDVDAVEELYEKFLIPLTKEVEVDYLLQRLDGLSEDEIEALRAK
ncbi:chorismate mutase aro7 [Serendipita sp. 399]|nr:chorismate mutase aro7 [Serendipita sp. 399]